MSSLRENCYYKIQTYAISALAKKTYSMPDTYEVRPVEDPQTWDDFVRTALGGSIFSSHTWLDCACRATNHALHCYGLYKNDSLLAAVSGLESRRTGFKRLTTPQLTPHGGLLFAPIPSKGPAKLEAEWGRATQLLIAHLLEHYDQVQLSLAPAIQDVREFTWSDWNARIRYTYQMDLSDLDSLWERVERRTRTVIRKAEKAGFTLQPTDDLDLFRRQYELIYAKQDGGPPIDPALVQSFATHALAAGLAQPQAIVSPEGDIASIVIFVEGFDTLYAWVAGADPAFNPSGATSLLYWRSFQQTHLKKFDFVGANMPAIAKFKRGFGGDLVPYFVVDGFKSGLVKTAVAGKNALQAWRNER